MPGEAGLRDRRLLLAAGVYVTISRSVCHPVFTVECMVAIGM
jgi:hypothetical protein